MEMYIPQPSTAGTGALEPVSRYRLHLIAQDMSKNTVEKYVRDVKKFLEFSRQTGPVTDHACVARYRACLVENYKPVSVNSMLAALNSYLEFTGRKEWCVSLLRIQREMFLDEARELTREEYWRLVDQARQDGNTRLYYMLQTLAGSGIRVGELPFITVEALGQKTVSVNFKGKLRQILLPPSLVEQLEEYCRMEGRRAGSIFVTRTGRPVDRRNIWKEMKGLCRKAGVDQAKVFPHNLRHLFARSYYEKEKDIVRLADYLGHSNVETTRRYTMTGRMDACRQQLEMGLTVERDAGGTAGSRRNGNYAEVRGNVEDWKNAGARKTVELRDRVAAWANAETWKNVEVRDSVEVRANAENWKNVEIRDSVEIQTNAEIRKDAVVRDNVEVQTNAETRKDAETRRTGEAGKNTKAGKRAETGKYGKTRKNIKAGRKSGTSSIRARKAGK